MASLCKLIHLFVLTVNGKAIIKFTRKLVPTLEDKIQRELDSAKGSIAESLLPPASFSKRFLSIPQRGLSKDEIEAHLDALNALSHRNPSDGSLSGTVYRGACAELDGVVLHALKTFSLSNPLHPDVFPGTRQMEAEVVSMTLALFNGNDGKCCGCVTSGGTESILLAIKSAKEYALKKFNVSEPEMVIPSSAHAAFFKGEKIFGVKAIVVPVLNTTGCANVDAMKKEINSNTILMVGSIPSFPHGIIDDIQALSKAIRENKVIDPNQICLHVDACLGSFIVPFLAKNDLIDKFDFSIPHVTSISCDTHKYGFAPKGTSVLMYSKRELLHHQYFVEPDWSGGIYASPTLAGSRPGALIAGAYATLLFTGLSGYEDAAMKIVATARKIANLISSTLKGKVRVVGEPKVSVVAFEIDPENNFSLFSNDIYGISDQMAKSENGRWNLNALQFPPALHFAVTFPSIDCHERFVNNLRASIDDFIEMKKQGKKKSGNAALYGMAASIPDRSIVEEVAIGFIDSLYLPK